jgi:hypothetical protein
MGRKFLTHASAGKESGYEGCTNGRTKSRLNARLDGRSAERTLSAPLLRLITLFAARGKALRTRAAKQIAAGWVQEGQ